jgi:hypothetical protein
LLYGWTPVAACCTPSFPFIEILRMIGFVILSHRSPEQLLRLCRTLNQMYGDPPIACHHDFAQYALDTTGFPPNIQFVRPSVATAWAKWSLVEATLAGLRSLYELADPAYFYLISAADYPTAPAEQVIADLERSPVDVHIDAFSLSAALKGDAPVGDAHLAHHRTLPNVGLARVRYLRAQVRVPILRLKAPAYSTTTERYPRPGRITIALPFSSPRSPFGRDYVCYVGSQWFTGNRRVAHKLLNPSPRDLRLQRYYRSRVVPDESYFQTVLCNDPNLTRDNRTFRWVRWGGAHPIDLGEADLPDIFASGAHFCRKFQPDAPVLDEIDGYLQLEGGCIGSGGA